jgi:hypothetical protein
MKIRRERDNAVGIATGYGLDDREVGVRVPVGSRILYSPRCPDRFWARLASYPTLSPGVKRSGREAGHSPPTIAEVKICGSIYPLPHTPSWRRS